MATKLRAASIATQAGVDVVVASGRRPDALIGAAKGEVLGTFFPAPGDRIESRKRWILAHISREGHVAVDAGAAAALRAQGRSLLPAGVARVGGSFQRGDAIEVRDPEGNRVAAGTINYGSAELERIRGLKSDRIAETLGYSFGDEVIHRDNMVLL
jgi:glutamate 5-kinase